MRHIMIKTGKRKALFYFISFPITCILLSIFIKLSNASTPEDIKFTIILPFLIIETCIVFFPFILLPIPQKDLAKFTKMVELFRPKTKHDDNKIRLEYTEKTENGYTSLMIRIEIFFSKRYPPEVDICIKRYGEIVLWTTLKYVNDRHLNMEYFSPEDKAWFKWYLKHYLDIFYKKSISKKANQLLKS